MVNFKRMIFGKKRLTKKEVISEARRLKKVIPIKNARIKLANIQRKKRKLRVDRRNIQILKQMVKK